MISSASRTFVRSGLPGQYMQNQFRGFSSRMEKNVEVPVKGVFTALSIIGAGAGVIFSEDPWKAGFWGGVFGGASGLMTPLLYNEIKKIPFVARNPARILPVSAGGSLVFVSMACMKLFSQVMAHEFFPSTAENSDKIEQVTPSGVDPEITVTTQKSWLFGDRIKIAVNGHEVFNGYKKDLEKKS